MGNRDIDIRMRFGAHDVNVKRGSPYRLISIDGIEAADYDIKIEEYSTIAGGFIANERYAPRQISMTIGNRR